MRCKIRGPARSESRNSQSAGTAPHLFLLRRDGVTEHSQLIRKIRTYDGKRSQDPAYVVATMIERDPPGMPVSGRLLNGRWMMIYELYGRARCIAPYRLSDDGWNSCSETCPKHQWYPNYSSSLLTARNGAQVLEFASDWTDRRCFSSYGWPSLGRDASPSGQDTP